MDAGAEPRLFPQFTYREGMDSRSSMSKVATFSVR